ncbi:MAG TPA: hypothetical protein VN851_22720 [Thermoanaerobaculia bacterium]|nr:hypothetical protein [Thermoanaerobaculia bacterium]
METKTKAPRAAKVQTIDPAAIARLLGAVQGGKRTEGTGIVIPQGTLSSHYHS